MLSSHGALRHRSKISEVGRTSSLSSGSKCENYSAKAEGFDGQARNPEAGLVGPLARVNC
jgi:hypothetical protein